jgi:hypothetical protein
VNPCNPHYNRDEARIRRRQARGAASDAHRRRARVTANSGAATATDTELADSRDPDHAQYVRKPRILAQRIGAGIDTEHRQPEVAVLDRLREVVERFVEAPEPA